MSQPSVQWRKRDNSEQFSQWAVGTVNAGESSAQTGFLVFNNYGGTIDLPDMEDVVVTTKGIGGVNTGAVVEGQWIKVKLDGVDNTFSPIGYDTATARAVTHPIRALGTTVFNGVTSKPNVAPHTSPNGIVDILGVANDGTKANSAGNYAEITAYADVPGDALNGYNRFLLRATFKFQ